MLGQDTEYFLWDTKEDKFVPSWEYVPKEKTYLCCGHGSKGVHAFRDGFAVEINTSPHSCRAWLWEDQRLGLSAARDLFRIPDNIKFINKPLVDISHLIPEMEKWPEDARILGCNPTKDAYKGGTKVINVNPLTLPFRTSGGHMHISSMDLPTPVQSVPQAQMMFIKLCDLFIGLPLAVVFDDDVEFERRTLYGTAGEYRVQNYPDGNRGIEYRVPSTRLYSHPAVMSLAFGMLRGVVADHFHRLVDHWNPAIEEPLQKAINTGVGAKEMLEELSKIFDFSSIVRNDWELPANSLCSGYKRKNYVSRRFNSYYGYEIDCIVKTEQEIFPFHPDMWLLIKEKINKDLTPEYDFEEAHKGAVEYFKEWQPERCQEETIRE
jgi:hypothetical protein